MAAHHMEPETELPEPTNLAEAAAQERGEIVAALLSRGARIDEQDKDGNTALHWSALLGMEALTSLLIVHNANKECRNNQGETPFHMAAKASKGQTLRILLEDAPERVLLLKDNGGRSPFALAATHNHAANLELLHWHGLSPEETDGDGRSALLLAAASGARYTVQWLLTRGADVHFTDRAGWTALHYAATQGHESILKMLVAAGASTFARTAAGSRPWWLALRKGHVLLALWLVMAAARDAMCGMHLPLFSVYAASVPMMIMYNLVLFQVVLMPYWMERSLYIALLSPTSMAGVLVLWAFATASDPGFLERRIEIEKRRKASSVPWPLSIDELVLLATSESEALASSEDIIAKEALQPLEELQYLCLDQWKRTAELRRRVKEIDAEEGSPTGTSTAKSSGFQARRHGEESIQYFEKQLMDAWPRLLKQLGKVRRLTAIRHGLGEYIDCVMSGDVRRPCIICRIVRDQRTFHCKECGHCVQRLDHHCPWIDRCIGLRNHRLFCCFLVLLCLSILGFFGASLGFLFEGGISWKRLLRKESMVVILSLVVDGLWAVFAVTLLWHQLAFMMVNLTTYEVLLAPPHVKRRFPRRDFALWYLQDCSLGLCLRSCCAFWQQDMSYDLCLFQEAAPLDPEGQSLLDWQCSDFICSDPPPTSPSSIDIMPKLDLPIVAAMNGSRRDPWPIMHAEPAVIATSRPSRQGV